MNKKDYQIILFNTSLEQHSKKKLQTMNCTFQCFVKSILLNISLWKPYNYKKQDNNK